MRSASQLRRVRRRPRTRTPDGFTLIEMLVAIAILSLIAVMAWRGLDATIRGRDSVVAQLTRTRTLGRVFSQLQFDMLNLAAPEEVFGAPLRLRPNELVIVRHIGIGSTTTHMQVVRYYLADHKLFRSASQPLETIGAVSGALKSMDQFAGVIASDDASAMKLSVWIPSEGWTSEQSVVAASYANFLKQHGIGTFSAVGMPLPRGIRFSLSIGNDANEFVRTIPIAQ